MTKINAAIAAHHDFVQTGYRTIAAQEKARRRVRRLFGALSVRDLEIVRGVGISLDMSAARPLLRRGRLTVTAGGEFVLPKHAR